MGLEICKNIADAIKVRVAMVLEERKKISDDPASVEDIKTYARHDHDDHVKGVPFAPDGGRGRAVSRKP